MTASATQESKPGLVIFRPFLRQGFDEEVEVSQAMVVLDRLLLPEPLLGY